MSPKKEQYTERINVFFTPEQLEQIKAKAEKLGLTVSAYVRMVAVSTFDDGLYDMGMDDYDNREDVSDEEKIQQIEDILEMWKNHPFSHVNGKWYFRALNTLLVMLKERELKYGEKRS